MSSRRRSGVDVDRAEPLRVLGENRGVVEDQTANGARERALAADLLHLADLAGVADRLALAEHAPLAGAVVLDGGRQIDVESADLAEEPRRVLGHRARLAGLEDLIADVRRADE